EAAPPERTLQRDAERLDRGALADPTEDGVLVSWRLLGDESMDTRFVVFRDGERITPEAITDSTNLLDPEGTTDSEYRIAIEGASASGKAVPGGSQGKNLVWASEAVTPWESSHLDVPLDRPAGFVAADGTEQTYRGHEMGGQRPRRRAGQACELRRRRRDGDDKARQRPLHRRSRRRRRARAGREMGSEQRAGQLPPRRHRERVPRRVRARRGEAVAH